MTIILYVSSAGAVSSLCQLGSIIGNTGPAVPRQHPQVPGGDFATRSYRVGGLGVLGM